MPAADALDRIDANEASKRVYAALRVKLDAIGPHRVEVKKSSLHVARDRAFLGVHPRRYGLLLNIVTASALTGERLHKVEKVSRNRWHNEVILTLPADVDDELSCWIRQAYELATPLD